MIKVFLILAFFSFNSFSQEKVKETDLNVAIGILETVRLDYSYSSKIQVGNDSILGYTLVPAKREISFNGLKPGKTSVIVRDKTGEIRDRFIVNVTSDGNSNVVRELRELMGDIEGLTITIKGGKVVVEGEIVVPSKIGKIQTILGQYPDVLSLIEYSAQTQIIVAREMQEAINQNGMKDVTVRIVNGDYWIEGVVTSEAKKTIALQIAEVYKPDVLNSLSLDSGGSRFQGKVRGDIKDFISVNAKKDPEPPPKLVQISAQFVELSKDYNRFFAFKWAPFMGTDSSISFGKTSEGGITTSEDGTLSGTISRLFPKLSTAKQAGYARVIQSGMVVVSEGKKATISKSSKINFSVGTGDFSQGKEADVSFNLNVTPRIGVQENVQLEGLTISVSLPNGKDAAGNPAVTSNSISTELVVKAKESAVIGGIVQSSSSTEYDKDDPEPVNAQGGEEGTQQSLPLFNLLRSKGYTTKKSQFVVFVTPKILESASAGTEEIRKKFKKRQR